MSHAANLVLYAIGESRLPIASADPKKPDQAAALFAHKSAQAMNDAEKRGVPFPELAVVLEEREADEAKTLRRSEYTRCNLRTLAPDGPVCASLDEVFVKRDEPKGKSK